MKGNGKKKALKPTSRDLRLASAIGQAVQKSIGPKLDAINERLDTVTERLDDHATKLDAINGTLIEHGRKLDQLISGAVGIGRVYALEQRVTELERQR